jgi:hypothetical protein
MKDPQLAHVINSNEQKALDRMLDSTIDFMEHEYLTEAPFITEGLEVGE